MQQSPLQHSGAHGERWISDSDNMQRRTNLLIVMVTPSHHVQAALAAMAPLHRSHTDGPRRHVLPKKASFKSKGSILSHVTSGTWEEDADIENPHDAAEARKSPRVRIAAKPTYLPAGLCNLLSSSSVTGIGEASISRQGLAQKPLHSTCDSACRACAGLPHAISLRQIDEAASVSKAIPGCAGAVA